MRVVTNQLKISIHHQRGWLSGKATMRYDEGMIWVGLLLKPGAELGFDLWGDEIFFFSMEGLI